MVCFENCRKVTILFKLKQIKIRLAMPHPINTGDYSNSISEFSDALILIAFTQPGKFLM
jgi:hypothetical protein